MKRSTFKEALEIRDHIKYGTLDKIGVLKKYKLSDLSFERIMSKETLKRPAKKRKIGTNAKGEDCGMSKLKKTEVLKVLVKWEKGHTQKSISEDLKISSSGVGKIIRGESWVDANRLFYQKKLKKVSTKIEALERELITARNKRVKFKNKIKELSISKTSQKGLTEADAKAILFYQKILSVTEMVEMVDNRVGRAAIYKILKRKTWKHLKRAK